MQGWALVFPITDAFHSKIFLELLRLDFMELVVWPVEIKVTDSKCCLWVFTSFTVAERKRNRLDLFHHIIFFYFDERGNDEKLVFKTEIIKCHHDFILQVEILKCLKCKTEKNRSFDHSRSLRPIGSSVFQLKIGLCSRYRFYFRAHIIHILKLLETA